MELDTTVATSVREPEAAPIHRMSWLPHWMSTLWCFSRESQMMSARGPRSKMSPTRWSLSTAAHLMRSQMEAIRSGAWPMAMTVEMMFSK